MVTIGVLALQGAFVEHISHFASLTPSVVAVEVRTAEDLAACDGLVLPGGESTTQALLAQRVGLWEPLKRWVAAGRPTWGTCAGLILLAEQLSNARREGQARLGGLDVHVARNAFGAQLSSFEGRLRIEDATVAAWTPEELPVAPHTALGGEASEPSVAPASAASGSSYEHTIAHTAIPAAACTLPSSSSHGLQSSVAVFVRAPAILSVGPGARVLATVQPGKLRASSLLTTLPEEDAEGSCHSSASRVIVAAATFVEGAALPWLLGTAFHPELTQGTQWHAFFLAMVQAAARSGGSSGASQA